MLGGVRMIKVVLIEDDLMVQEVNRQFIDKVTGFKVVGSASNGLEGMEMIRDLVPDLVLVDVYMPHQDGLKTLKQIRTENHKVDVIAITAASDMATVRAFIQQGAFDYVMKPFKFERIEKALENYRCFHGKINEKKSISQQEFDEIFSQKDPEPFGDIPKGLNALTLSKITAFLSESPSASSAEEVAEGIGIARVTARRYLDFLEKSGKVKIDIQYGGIGRPINKYLL